MSNLNFDLYYKKILFFIGLFILNYKKTRFRIKNLNFATPYLSEPVELRDVVVVDRVKEFLGEPGAVGLPVEGVADVGLLAKPICNKCTCGKL